MKHVIWIVLILATGCREPSSYGNSAGYFSLLCDTPRDYKRLFVFERDITRRLPKYYNYEEALACARRQQKGVLIYFTSIDGRSSYSPEYGWFGNDALLQKLKDNFIPVCLLTDDPIYGDANNDFEADSFRTNAIPMLFFVDTDGREMGRCEDWHNDRLRIVVDSILER